MGDGIKATNAWHYMGQGGMYIGSFGFDMFIGRDGKVKSIEIDLDTLAKSKLGNEIINDINTNKISIS